MQMPVVVAWRGEFRETTSNVLSRNDRRYRKNWLVTVGSEAFERIPIVEVPGQHDVEHTTGHPEHPGHHHAASDDNNP